MNHYQQKVKEWLTHCFGESVAISKLERNYRFLEEALELVQAAGCTKEQALQLVDYVFNRPVGELKQEVGGTMVTLSGLCSAHDVSLEECAMTELQRVWEKKDLIRQKWEAKTIKDSPLPINQ
jgi:hypothetical protein